MSRIYAKILLVLAAGLAALALAGTASAGWTWDGSSELVWTDDSPEAQ
jgi:hypothetical protein